MAYLNLRERRIEAKIAYVGPELAGKATNFEQLLQSGRDSRIGRIESVASDASEMLALTWHPTQAGQFRDCDVLVQVVAQRGVPSEDRVRDALHDADGVVLVLDAHPSAQEKNRATLAALKSGIARSTRPNVPVVVQVNKTDLADALSQAELSGALDAGAAKWVSASAANGQGVLETLEAALSQVLAAMQSEGQVEGHTPGETSRPSGENGTNAAVRDGAHPLLSALRQVLRDTAREQAEDLEARVTARVADSIARIERRVMAIDASVASLREQMDASSSSSPSHAEPASVGSDVVKQLEALEAKLREVAEAAHDRATKQDLSLVTMGFERLRDELKAEVVRVIDARGKSDREHLGATATQLRKSFEGLSTEFRTVDVRGRVGEVVDLVKDLAKSSIAVADRMESASDGVRAVPPRLDQVEKAIKERTVKVEQAVRDLGEDVTGQLAATDEKVQDVQRRVHELIEEMKKPKKGWFG